MNKTITITFELKEDKTEEQIKAICEDINNNHGLETIAINSKPIKDSEALKCAKEFAEWLGKNELNSDVSIYVDHKRYKVSDDGKLIYDIDTEPNRYLDYCGDFMSVSTEGPLYEIINYFNDFLPTYDDRMNNEIDAIFKKYGMYKELGNAWNFSLYRI